MRFTMIAALFGAMAFLSTPAMAGHRHSRSCGHYSSGYSRGVGVIIATPWGGGAFFRDPGYRRRYNSRRRYDNRRYYDDRYYDGRRGHDKRHKKAKKRYRRGGRY